MNIEVQAAYITQCVNAMRKFNVKVLEVKEEPTREYNAWLDRRLENTVWAKGSSFYRLGQNRNGRIFVSDLVWFFPLPRRLTTSPIPMPARIHARSQRRTGLLRLRCIGGKILRLSGKTGSARTRLQRRRIVDAGECLSTWLSSWRGFYTFGTNSLPSRDSYIVV